MFRVICAGWNCAKFITNTLDSIDWQGRRDFEVMISYEAEPGDAGFDIINRWVDNSREPWRYHTRFRFGEENFLYGTKARYDGIHALHPEDEDVIVWLNIDGDRFPHDHVLDYLWDAYSDGFPLLTYGSFITVPQVGAPLIAKPYDNKVIIERSFRRAPFRAADLRTMKYKVFKAIPIDQFQDANGQWYRKIDDVTSMIPALEMVGIRHRYIEDVLMHYNTLNPLSGTAIAPAETEACDIDFRSKAPLPLMF